MTVIIPNVKLKPPASRNPRPGGCGAPPRRGEVEGSSASRTRGWMGASRAPNVTIGCHSIVVQGDADKDAIATVDRKIAAANEQQYRRIVLDLPRIQCDSLRTG